MKGALEYRHNTQSDGWSSIIHREADGCAITIGITTHEQAERIVACVNACEGLNPEGVPDLLAHLEHVAQALEIAEAFGGEWAGTLERARKAMAKAKDLICGHSACSQHYIDTGERLCIEGDKP